MKLIKNVMVVLAAASLVACGSDSSSDANGGDSMAKGGAAANAGGAAANAGGAAASVTCEVAENPGIGEITDANKETNCTNACTWLASCAVNTGDCSGYTKCGADDYKAVFDGCMEACKEDTNSLLLKAAQGHTMCSQTIMLASLQNETIKANCSDEPAAGGAAATGGMPATGGEAAAGGAAAMAPTMSIAEIAQGNADLSKLVEAAVAAGIAGELGDSSKTFTVFAPTNAAFDALGTLPEGDDLKAVLMAHVIANAAVKSGDLMNGAEVATMHPTARLKVAIDGDNVTITLGEVTAQVVIKDIMATNGVVHVIDKVLVPPAN